MAKKKTKKRRVQKVGRGVKSHIDLTQYPLAEPIFVAPPDKPLLKLDLGCGDRVEPGHEGCDIWAGPNVKHVINLTKPWTWPWLDNTVDAIHCSHFCEHLPMVYVGKNDAGEWCHKIVNDKQEDTEMFLSFMNKCFSIMKDGAKMKIIVPTDSRGDQDPSHRRFFTSCSFLYLSEDWRKANKLEHYNCYTAFGQEGGGIMHPYLAGRSPEARQWMTEFFKNAYTDLVVTLTARKDAPAAPAK